MTGIVKRQTIWALCFSGIFAFALSEASAFAQSLRSGTYRVETLAEDGQRYSSTWKLQVRGLSVAGDSAWDCCPGRRIDPLNGRISGDWISIDRRCTGQGIREQCLQVYEGRIEGDLVRGTFTYNGSYGGRWVLFLRDSAYYRDWDRDWPSDRDRWGRDRGGRRNIDANAVRDAVAKIEILSDETVDDIKKLNRRDPLIRQLEDQMKDFENAADKLEDDLRKAKNDPWAIEGEVRILLVRGNQIDLLMARANVSSEVRNDWSEIRARLDLLEDAYGLGRGRIGDRGRGRHLIDAAAVGEAIAKIEILSDETVDDIGKLNRRDSLIRQLENEMKDFENAADKLEDNYKKAKNDPWAVEGEVQSLLDRGRRIDDLIRRSNVSAEVRQDWAEIRVRLNLLADAYRLPRV